jgi:N-acetylmuramoyl-L-alanine amidase
MRKRDCIQTTSVVSRYLSLERIASSHKALKFARLLGEAMIARGFSPTLHHAEKIPSEGRSLLDKNLGLYEFSDLIVLKTAAMPAVLLECGVIVNRSEEASLQKPETQERIADAAAEAIVKFMHAGSRPADRRRLDVLPVQKSLAHGWQQSDGLGNMRGLSQREWTAD